MTVAKRNKRVKPILISSSWQTACWRTTRSPNLIGGNVLLKQLIKMLVERTIKPEMSEQLGHGKSEAVTNATGNTRNVSGQQTLLLPTSF
jgi:putative transposase